MPTQTGDGSYVKREAPASLFENLKAIGIADVKTLKDVLTNKAKREHIDDKTYLMERVIQVFAFFVLCRMALTRGPARCEPPCQLVYAD